MSRESVLLTGGASERMGRAKAALPVAGEPLGARLARLLRSAGWEPTVLGTSPVAGHRFLEDRAPLAGPLAALRGFVPSSELVFVLSCDVPLFDPRVPEALLELLGNHGAVLPALEGRLQPLCALYRACAWDSLAGARSPRVLDWATALPLRVVGESELEVLGVSADWLRSANTPSELEALLSRASGNAR